MKSHFLSCLLTFAIAASVATAAETLPEPDTGESLPDWELLKDLDNVRSGVVAAGGAVTNEEMAAAYLARADALGDFHDRGAPGGDAAEAKRLQALALLFAAWSGDTSRAEERNERVAEVRADEALDPNLRSEVAAYAENLEVIGREFTTRTDRLLAFEAKARLLQAEFPSVADNYEALLQLAKSQDDANGERIIDDLLRLPAADWIVSEAETLKGRYGLIGKDLAELLTPPQEVQEAIDQAEGRAVLMYTWSVASKASIALAKALGASIKSDASLVGINLDAEPVAAKSAAAEASLPGDQLYADAAGYEALITALALTEPALVYEINGAGLISSVSARSRIKRSAREEQP